MNTVKSHYSEFHRTLHTHIRIYAHLAHSSNSTAVFPRMILEIVVSIQILSDYLDILSDPKKAWYRYLAEHYLMFISHTHSDVTKSFVLKMSIYAFPIKFC